MHQRRQCSSSEERTNRHYPRRSRSPLKRRETHYREYRDRNESPSRYSRDYLRDRSSTSENKALPHHFHRHGSLSRSPRRLGRQSPFHYSSDLRNRKSHSPQPKLRGESPCYLDIDESSLHFSSNHLKPEEHKYHYTDIKEHYEYNECHYNRSPHTSPEFFPPFTDEYNTDLCNSNRLNGKISRDTYLQSSHTHEEPATTESLEYKNKNLSSATSRAPTPGRYFDLVSNYQYKDSRSSSPTFQCTVGIKNRQADDRAKKPKLSGAGRKRYQRYLMQGMTQEEAREKALRPIAATATTYSDKKLLPGHPTPRGFTEDWQSKTRHAVGPKDNQPDDRETMLRLSGAGKKRLKYYLTQGMRREEAQERALRPIAAKASTYPDKVPPKEEFQKDRLYAPPKPPTASLAVGIIHASFPEKSLTIKQLDDIQESITDQIVALGLRRADLQPTFHSVRQRSGWISLKCADKATADWLKSIATNLRPEKDVPISVVEESKIPQKEILVVRLLRSQDYSNEKILTLLGVQNDLNASQWRVLERIQVGAVVEMTIEVDERSTVELKKKAYKLSYKFGHVQLKAKKTS